MTVVKNRKWWIFCNWISTPESDTKQVKLTLGFTCDSQQLCKEIGELLCLEISDCVQYNSVPLWFEVSWKKQTKEDEGVVPLQIFACPWKWKKSCGGGGPPLIKYNNTVCVCPVLSSKSITALYRIKLNDPSAQLGQCVSDCWIKKRFIQRVWGGGRRINFRAKHLAKSASEIICQKLKEFYMLLLVPYQDEGGGVAGDEMMRNLFA